MKRGIKRPVSLIRTNIATEGKSIEETIRQMIAGKQPIQGSAKIYYTERKDGVHPEYDIRTDRFEQALMASTKVHATNMAKRMEQDGFFKDENGNWIAKPVETAE